MNQQTARRIQNIKFTDPREKAALLFVYRGEFELAVEQIPAAVGVSQETFDSWRFQDSAYQGFVRKFTGKLMLEHQPEIALAMIELLRNKTAGYTLYKLYFNMIQQGEERGKMYEPPATPMPFIPPSAGHFPAQHETVPQKKRFGRVIEIARKIRIIIVYLIKGILEKLHLPGRSPPRRNKSPGFFRQGFIMKREIIETERPTFHHHEKLQRLLIYDEA